MNQSFWKENQDRILFLAIALLSTIGAGFFMHRGWIIKEMSHYSEHQATLDTAFRASVQSYRLAMESFFYNSIATPSTLELFEQGADAHGKARDLARGKLYRHLYPAYELMKRQNLLQLQFHLADGTSYLRFSKPESYGDPLFEARPGVRICNTEKRIVQGFEMGKVQSGFCYIFPIISKGRHLGSVEVSVTFKSILEELKELDPNREYAYVLNRTLADKYLFADQKWLYSPAALHNDYLIEDAKIGRASCRERVS
jgi:hypothetical protein